MSSPFTTVEAFNSAADGPTEGAIYTFAQAPIFNYIALIVSVVLFVWFIIKTYSTPVDGSHADGSHIAGSHTTTSSASKSNNHLVPLFVIGLLSLSAANIKQLARFYDEDSKTSRQPALTDTKKAINFFSAGSTALIGMMSAGSSPLRKWAVRKDRRSKYRSLKNLR